MTLELQNTVIWFPAWTSFELSYIHWSQTNGLTTSAGISNQWTIWPPTCKINYVNMRNNYVHMWGGGYASITSQLCIIAPSYYNLTIRQCYVHIIMFHILSVQNIWRYGDQLKNICCNSFGRKYLFVRKNILNNSQSSIM